MLGPVMMKGVIIAGWPLALSVVALISLIMLNDETGFLSGLPLKPLSGEFFAIITFYSANAFLGILMRLSWQARHRAEDLSRQLSQLNTNLEQRVAEQVEELERTHNLKRFLSPQVVDMILTQSGKANLAVARKNLTILFADIRGFTSLSETMEPEELIETLNEYLDAMTQIVFAHGGTLDKYLGDGIMVFVGDPVPCDDHAERAVRMASDMQAKLKELQAEWFSEERECLQMGVGIATGYVTVGNIGSRDRMEYTVIGRNVNLASRLSGQAGPGQILISQQTHRAAKEIAELKSWGEVELKGFHKPVDVFEVMRLKQISPF
jgi:class 3 adenylate cyclase